MEDLILKVPDLDVFFIDWIWKLNIMLSYFIIQTLLFRVTQLLHLSFTSPHPISKYEARLSTCHFFDFGYHSDLIIYSAWGFGAMMKGV